MQSLTLSDAERDVVRHALGAYLSELRMEVHATDSFDMREQLKQEEALLTDVIARLDDAGAGGEATLPG